MDGKIVIHEKRRRKGRWWVDTIRKKQGLFLDREIDFSSAKTMFEWL